MQQQQPGIVRHNHAERFQPGHGRDCIPSTCVASATNDCSLDADETYFLVMNALNSSLSAAYKWPSWTSTSEDIWPANSDWEIANDGRSKFANTWSSAGTNITFPIHVSADNKGTLSASSITSTGATLTLNGYSGTNWYYKHNGSGATCSSAQTGTSAAVTGLTQGTSYTFTAYDGSSCAQAISSTVTFSTAGLVFTPSAPTVNENGTGTYTVKLSRAPSANVTVAIAAATTGSNSADTDITVQDTDDGTTGDQTTDITFTSVNWNTARTITLAAKDDTDKLTGARDIVHTATSTDSAYSGLTARLTATEVENDPAIVVIPAALSVAEGGSATYTVRLSTTPTQSVTVALTDSGDSDITYNKTSLTFTTTDWSTNQTVTVSAGSDTDNGPTAVTLSRTPPPARILASTG